MRSSDWISDVCSSDLTDAARVWGSSSESSAPAGTSKIRRVERSSPPVDVPNAISRPSGDGEYQSIADVTSPEASAGSSRTCPGPSDGSLRERTTRSEEHTSELQSLMRISYDVFCLQKKR